MQRGDGHAVQRPPVALAVGLVLVLAGMFLAGPPGAAQAQQAEDEELPHNFDVEAACQEGEAPDPGFQDIEGTTHESSIECLHWYGLTRGRTTTEYGPTQPIQRGQAATFLTNLLEEIDGFTMPAPEEGAFSDIEGTTHESNIEQLAGFDPPIVNGYPDDTFRPQQFIERDQFASIIDTALARVADQVDEFEELPDGSVGQFDDVSQGNVHSEAVERLADAGIVLGRTEDRYFPDATLERGQSATIFARVLGGLVYVGQTSRPANAPAGTVAGEVHDASNAQPNESGPPIEDAAVHVRGDAARTLSTDANGEFIESLPPGNYTLTVEEAGWVPYRIDVELTDDEIESLDFRMYRSAQPPGDDETIEESDTTVAHVDPQDNFWVIPLIVDGNTLSADDADDIILSRPDGVVLRLESAGTDASWWNHHGDYTSNRGGDQAGDHILYYDFDGTWYTLTATFDENGTLIAVNGVTCTTSECTPDNT